MRVPANQLGALAAAAVSFFAARYAGVFALFPAIGGVLALLVCKKTTFGPRLFQWAICAAFAHLTWFVIGTITSGNTEPLGDIAVLAVGIVSLWVRPTRLTALFLAIPTVVFLVVNLVMFTSAPIGSAENKVLFMHVVLRLALLAGLWEGVSELKRLTSAAAAAPST